MNLRTRRDVAADVEARMPVRADYWGEVTRADSVKVKGERGVFAFRAHDPSSDELHVFGPGATRGGAFVAGEQAALRCFRAARCTPVAKRIRRRAVDQP